MARSAALAGAALLLMGSQVTGWASWGRMPVHGGAQLPVQQLCPRSPTAHRFYPGFNLGIGTGPVRAVGPWAGRHATLPLGPRQQYGFPQKVLWAVRRGRVTMLTMRGWSAVMRRPILFQFPDRPGRQGQQVRRVGVVRSTSPSMVPAGSPKSIPWLGFGSTMYFPEVGCYVLWVRWHGGGWTVPFQAG